MSNRKMTPTSSRDYRFLLAPVVPINYYVPAIAICDDCHQQIKCIIGRDKFIDHECNQGNVRHAVPTQVSWKA
jgi:hypothetical protein